MQAGERQLHLRLHPHRPGHPHIRRRPGHVLQQRRLAHPRLAPHHQRPPASRPQIPQQAIEHRALSLAVQQRRHRLRSPPHAHLRPHFSTSPPARLSQQVSGARLRQRRGTQAGQARRYGDCHLQPTDRPRRLSRGVTVEKTQPSAKAGTWPLPTSAGDRKLSAGAHAELGEHLVQVVLDRSRADEELTCYLRVRVPLGSQPYDLPLLGGENVAALDRPLADRLRRRGKARRTAWARCRLPP